MGQDGRQRLLPGKPSPASPTPCPKESHQRASSWWEVPGQAPKAATSAAPHTSQAPAGSGEHRERQLHLQSSGQGDLGSSQVRELPGSACGREAECVSRRGFPPAPDSSGTAERFPNSLTVDCYGRGEEEEGAWAVQGSWTHGGQRGHCLRSSGLCRAPESHGITAQ